MDAVRRVSLFGQRVAAMRDRRGWTQQDLAAKAHIPYQTIWKIENGTLKSPSLIMASRIARALDADLNWLAGLYDERELVVSGCGLGWNRTPQPVHIAP